MVKYIQRRKGASGLPQSGPQGPEGQECGIGAFRIVESTRWLLILGGRGKERGKEK